MRVNQTSIDSLGTHASTGGVGKLSLSSAFAGATTGVSGSGDHANLSSAADLVALAKSASAPGRSQKISGLTLQVQSGSYQGNVSRASHAMVNELLQNGTSRP